MDNSNSNFNIDGSLGLVSLLTTINGGEVEIKPNQTLFLDGIAGYSPTVNSTMTVDANGTLDGLGTVVGPSLTNYGVIRGIEGPISFYCNSVNNYGTIDSSYITSSSLTNTGSISANGGTTVITVPSWSNAGQMSASNGGVLDINSNTWTNNGPITVDGSSTIAFNGQWINNGSITAQPGSSVEFASDCTTAQILHGFTYNGAGFVLTANLDNSNATLNLDHSLGSVFNEGSISGGGVHIYSGQSLTSYYPGSISAAITIDPGATMDSEGAGTSPGTYCQIFGPSLVNHGTLSGEFILDSDAVYNDGTINLAGTLIRAGKSLDVGPGTLTGYGNIQTATLQFDNDPSTLLFQVPQDLYDSYGMDITGNVVLGGDLLITVPHSIDYSLDPSYTFILMTVDPAYTLMGSFLDVLSGERLASSDGSGSFEVDYGGSGEYADEILLTNYQPTIPEPATRSLAGCACIFFICRRVRTSTTGDSNERTARASGTSLLFIKLSRFRQILDKKF